MDQATSALVLGEFVHEQHQRGEHTDCLAQDCAVAAWGQAHPNVCPFDGKPIERVSEPEQDWQRYLPCGHIEPVGLHDRRIAALYQYRIDEARRIGGRNGTHT